AEVKPLPAFRNRLPTTPAPAAQLQLPFTIDRSARPPSIRRRFKSVMGDGAPEKVCDKFQFSSLASTKMEVTRSARPSSGEDREANTRRFCASHRTQEEKLTARSPMLYHSG